MTRSRRIAQDNKSIGRSRRPVSARYCCSALVGVVGAGIAHRAQLALVAHGGGHRRDSDLAVAVVEVGELAAGVFLRLRCLQRVHKSHVPSWQALSSGLTVLSDWGGNTQAIVRYRDICRRALSWRNIPGVKVNPALRFSRQADKIMSSQAVAAAAAFLQQVHRKGPAIRRKTWRRRGFLA